MAQTFQDASTQHYTDLTVFPGASWCVLAADRPTVRLANENFAA